MRHINMSFFKFVSHTFGIYSVKLMKEWINLRKINIKNRTRIFFLKGCLQSSIVPPHLTRFKFNPHFYNCNSGEKFTYIQKTFIRRLIKLELNDAYKTVNDTRNRSFVLMRQISQHLPPYMCDTFFGKQELFFKNFMCDENIKIKKKFVSLSNNLKNNINVNNIKSINYTLDNCDIDTYNIGINPSEFQEGDASSSLSTIRDG